MHRGHDQARPAGQQHLQDRRSVPQALFLNKMVDHDPLRTPHAWITALNVPVMLAMVSIYRLIELIEFSF